MKILNAQTIRGKLILITVSITAFTLVLTSIAFLLQSIHASYHDTHHKLAVIGNIIAKHSAVAIARQDHALLAQHLSSLEFDNSIEKACIYDNSGILIVSDQINKNQPACPTIMTTAATNSLYSITQYFPIEQEGELIGTLYIASNDDAIIHRFYKLNTVFTLTIIASIFLALLLASLLQKLITSPLTHLGETILNIIQQNDFSIRTKRKHNDELGHLSDIFNKLLSKIEKDNSALKSSEEKFRKLTALSPVGIFQISPQGEITYVNQRWCEINNTTETTPTLKTWFTSIHPEDSKILAKHWDNLVVHHEDIAIEIRLISKSKKIIWAYLQSTSLHFKDGKLMGFLGSLSDISELKKAQFKMESLAFYDPLTGLANRRLFKNRLEKAVKSVQRTNTSIALLFLDLDQFKRVNDSLGHDIGDYLLKEIAQRLSKHVHENDTVSRIGGDEFTILLTSINSITDVRVIAEKILISLARPFTVHGQEIISSVSIGITLTPEDSVDSNTLMKNADLAMYRAKELGRNNFQFFSEDMNVNILYNLEIEKELNVAIKKDQFILMYQPKISLIDNSITGVETLVRWRHPQKGLIPPDDFIPIAEETGQIIKIGAWVLEHSCHEMGAMIRDGLMPADSKVAVNLSAKQFSDPLLLQTVIDILTQSKIDPLNLELEITESIIMDDVEAAINIMNAIKRRGINLSIDDFGTGYSSLAYLKRFPIDVLKVDRSFVKDIPKDQTDMAITSAVIAMAHKLGMTVVAEGIETQEQLDFLRANQCDDGQGYLLSRPLTLPQLHHFLVSNYGKNN